jgi:8-oxo-dGTP pyrophosphatase MutT (NUDIX family)
MLLIGRRLLHDMKLRSILLKSAAAFSLSSSAFGGNSAFHALVFAANNNAATVPLSRINMSTAPPNDVTDNPVQLLPLQDGSHNSAKVVITPAFDRTDFRERLQHTLDSCRSEKKTSLWVEVPMSCAGLIEEMQDFGLEFHHAQGDTASLNVWLSDSTNKIPEFATHHVGVGAIVVNSRNEILCVREMRRNLRPWKLPGGLSDLGEDIDEAVIREVMEETGIACRFKSIVSFRHSHGMSLGRSDLYFVCRLDPIENVDDNGNVIIPEPVACEEEIEAAAWVPLEDYRFMIDSKEGHPMMQHVMKLYDEDCEIQQTVMRSIVPGRKPSPIYHPPLQSKTAPDDE